MLLAVSLPVFGSDMGRLKPGARFAPGSPIRVSAPAKAAAAAAGKAEFYAVTSDNSGSTLSSFTAGYASELSGVMALEGASGFAGSSKDYDFYYCDFTTNSMGGITAVNWNRVDVGEKKVTFTKAQTTANGVCMDMTYDATTDTFYGISAMADAIVTIDAETGTGEFAFETMPFYTLSADASGQLYGILLEAGGEAALYSVNKLTGNALKIGGTGVKMLTSGGAGYFQTAAFSRADGKLYWLTPSQSGTDLYRVDVATGRASLLCTLDTMEALCLFDLPGAQAAGCPAAPAAVSATADGTGVAVAFTAPALTAGGEPLSALKSVDIYRGNAVTPDYSLTDPVPGKSYIWTDSAPKDGFNTYRLVAVNDEGESLPVYASVYCGVDYPQAPESVTAAVGADGYPLLAWKAPAKGINGLDMDAAALTYNIYRNEGGADELIAEGVKETEYRDGALDLTRQAYTYYYVSAVSRAGEGRKSAPAGVHTGPAYALPFTETFEEGEPATAPWLMQSLALGGSWEIGIVSNAPGTGPYVGAGMLIFKGFVGVAAGAEARIVTPVLDLGEGSGELHFHFYHADFGEDMHFDDHLVVEVSADGGEFEPLPGADLYQYTANTRWTEYVFPLDKYAGKHNVRIGFHGISAAGMDLVVDNVRVLPKDVSVGAVGTEEAPAEYYDLQGIRVANPSGGIFIRLQGGKATKVRVF